jgi:hypothetical protein
VTLAAVLGLWGDAGSSMGCLVTLAAVQGVRGVAGSSDVAAG